MAKLRVAVLRGGPSEEYDVSMKTGEGVLGALDRERFEPVDVVITKGGEWLVSGRVSKPESVLHLTDVAFLALHGAYGEDGQVQRMLDRLGVRYTGSRAYPSAIAMNKMMTKDLLRDHNIFMPQHMIVGQENKGALQGMVGAIGELFGPKYIVKPIASGSSVGVEKVESLLMLHEALEKALGQYDSVLVEECIDGKEATCGVINNFRGKDVYVLPPIEIVPPSSSKIFDYTVKYDGSTEEICPGRFRREEKDEIERVARLVHEVLGLSQYSRSDFMISPHGEAYFLEVNTLPGMTAESLMPKGLDAVGSSYKEFVEHLIEDALKKDFV